MIYRCVNIIKLCYIFTLVVGCPNPPKPHDGWVRRQGNDAVAGCIEDVTEWQMSCRDGVWHGTVHNCTGGKNYNSYNL